MKKLCKFEAERRNKNHIGYRKIEKILLVRKITMDKSQRSLSVSNLAFKEGKCLFILKKLFHAYDLQKYLIHQGPIFAYMFIKYSENFTGDVDINT